MNSKNKMKRSGYEDISKSSFNYATKKITKYSPKISLRMGRNSLRIIKKKYEQKFFMEGISLIKKI